MAKRDRYMSEFTKVRPQVLSRDGNCCVKCGSTLSLEVHHIDGYKNNAPEMLVTLCYLCHGVAPMGKELFAQWLVLGESGVDTIRREIKGRNIPRMTRDQIIKFCEVLEKVGLVGNRRKMKQARDEMRDAGIFKDGRHPYGVKQGEEIILARMKAMRTQDPPMCCEEIADILNAENIPTRMAVNYPQKGYIWKAPTIWKILSRELPKKEKQLNKEKRKRRAIRAPHISKETDDGGVWVPVMMHGQEMRKITS